MIPMSWRESWKAGGGAGRFRNIAPITMPNVILTGHSGFYSITSDRELFYKAMTQVVMALKGEWPTYGLNPEIREAWLNKWGREA
jgi:hypothetical protein